MDLLGEGIVRVAADTAPAENAMRRLAADFDRRMADMDRQRAEATVTADITQLERKIVEARGELLDLEKQKATAEIDGDTDGLDRAIKKARLELKALSNEKAKIQVDAKELRAANQELARNSKAQQDNAKTTAAANAARAKAAAEATKATERESQAIQRRGQQQARAIADNDRFNSSLLENARNLDKLRESYAKTYGERQRLEKQTGRPGGIFRSAGETRALRSTISEMDLLEHKIRALGGTVDDIDPELERHQGVLGRWASSISSIRLQLGFFSATLRQVAGGLVVLGPIVSGLAGGLISLVGVLGSGVAGAGAVGAAGLAGFVTSALGVGLVIHPMIKDFSEAKKASEALTKAQLQYGKGSEQAKTAQEKFNNVMKGVSPTAREAFKDYSKLGESWRDLTKSAKPAVFNSFAQGVKTVQALLPGFAKESVATTKTAAHAWDGWMKSLRSSEAKQLLGDVMSNFRKAIPGLSSGLASLGAAFGRIAASASKLLPSLSHGFADWANNLEDSIGSGDKLDQSIQHMVTHMRDLGHLGQDTGSLLVHFFGSSADSGDDLVNSLDRVVKRWDAWATSVGGQKSLKNFFGEAVTETKQFFGAIAPLTQLLFQMSRAFAPITSGALTAVHVVGDFVQELSKLPGLSSGLKVLGGALAGIWAVGKIRGAASAIGGLVTSLSRLAGVDAASGVLGMLFGRGARTATAATTVERTGEALIKTGGAASVAAPEVAAFSALLAPEVLIPVGAVAALVAFSLSLGDTQSAFEEAGSDAQDARKHFRNAVNGFVQDGTRYNASIHKQVGANAEAKQARNELVAAQNRYGVVSKQALAAQERLTNAEQKQTVTAYQGARARAESVNQARAAVRSAKEEIRAREQQIHTAKQANQEIARGENLNTAFGNPHEAEQVAFAVHKLSIARQEAAAAGERMAVANIPLVRQNRELLPLTEQTVTGLKKLSATIGAAATKKIGTMVDPKAVQQITNLGNKLTKLGRGSQVKNIAVKSTGAEQTTAKLRQLQKQTARVEGARATVKVSANDTGAQRTLKAVSRESQRIAGSRATIRILANSDNAEQAIQRLHSHLMSVINKSYKAELKAEDKSGAAAAAFHHNLQRPATQKYEAKLTAVDRATNVAKQAESSAKRVASGRYQAKLTAVNQATGVIQGAISELESYDGRTAKSVITTEHVTVNRTENKGGHFAGGPSTYVSAFALGGDRQQEMLDRAADRAVVRQGGRSQVVRRPTMLTGEEAPRYNEYVIATNPAYKRSNQRYLGQAATDLGYEVVPAARSGISNNRVAPKRQPQHSISNNQPARGGGGGGGNQASASSAAPEPDWHKILMSGPKKKSVSTPFYIRTKKFDKTDVNLINALEELVSNRGRAYNILQDREENEIKAHKRTSWNFPAFEKILGEERKAYGEMNSAKARVEKDAGNELSHANNALSGPLSAGKVNAAGRAYNAADRAYSNIHKGKEETSAAYNKRKDRAKAQKEAAKRNYEKLKKERENAKTIAREAKEAIREVREKRREAENDLDELSNEEQLLGDYQRDPSLAPYYEPPETPEEEAANGAGGAGSGSTEEPATPMDYARAALAHAQVEHNAPAEQAAKEGILAVARSQYSAALATPDPRDDVTAAEELKSAEEALIPEGPSIAEQTSSYNKVRQSLYQNFASNLSGAGASLGALGGGISAASLSPGSLAYFPSGGAAGPAAATAGTGSSTINNVTNNFAAPPPDPHTWTAQQAFDLGALA